MQVKLPESQVDLERDFGKTLSVSTIKSGLQELIPDLTFDPGGNLGLLHPRQDEWMGIYQNGRHLAAMDRKDPVPEYNVYDIRDGKVQKVLRVGWRHTFERLTRRGVVTWTDLCRKFNVDYKYFRGHAIELDESKWR